jgi:hypothetical protein
MWKAYTASERPSTRYMRQNLKKMQLGFVHPSHWGRLRAGFGPKSLKNALKPWNSRLQFRRSGRRKCHGVQPLQSTLPARSSEWGSGALCCFLSQPAPAGVLPRLPNLGSHEAFRRARFANILPTTLPTPSHDAYNACTRPRVPEDVHEKGFITRINCRCLAGEVKTRQVEGLVPVKGVQVRSLSPALLQWKGLRRRGVNPLFIPALENGEVLGRSLGLRFGNPRISCHKVRPSTARAGRLMAIVRPSVRRCSTLLHPFPRRFSRCQKGQLHRRR